MVRHSSFMILIVLLASIELFGQDYGTNLSIPPKSEYCGMLGAPNLRVELRDIVSIRVPSSPSAAVIPACRNTVQNQISEWTQDELGHSSQLLNRLCSYKLGWVEKVPGTCQAGGPPPICPVDHWMQIGTPNATQKMYSVESLILACPMLCTSEIVSVAQRLS
jgi:hypothetical protein